MNYSPLREGERGAASPHRRNAIIAFAATSSGGVVVALTQLYRAATAYAEGQWFSCAVYGVVAAVLLWAFATLGRMFYLWVRIHEVAAHERQEQQRRLDASKIEEPAQVQEPVQALVAPAPEPTPPRPPSRNAFEDEDYP